MLLSSCQISFWWTRSELRPELSDGNSGLRPVGLPCYMTAPPYILPMLFSLSRYLALQIWRQQHLEILPDSIMTVDPGLANNHFKIYWGQEFPCGPVVKKPPCKAMDMGSIPGRRTKIPCAAGRLSSRTTTKTRPCLINKDWKNK